MCIRYILTGAIIMAQYTTDYIYLYDPSKQETEAVRKCFEELQHTIKLFKQHGLKRPFNNTQTLVSVELKNGIIEMITISAYGFAINTWCEWKQKNYPSLRIAVDSSEPSMELYERYVEDDFFDNEPTLVINVYDNLGEYVDSVGGFVKLDDIDRLYQIADYLYPEKGEELNDCTVAQLCELIRDHENVDFNSYIINHIE